MGSQQSSTLSWQHDVRRSDHIKLMQESKSFVTYAQKVTAAQSIKQQELGLEGEKKDTLERCMQSYPWSWKSVEAIVIPKHATGDSCESQNQSKLHQKNAHHNSADPQESLQRVSCLCAEIEKYQRLKYRCEDGRLQRGVNRREKVPHPTLQPKEK